MAFNEDIIVEVIPGAASVSRVGFGIPAIVSILGQRSVLSTGESTSKLIAKSVARHVTISLEIVTGGAFAYVFAGGVVTIDVPVGTLVRELIADFDANAPTSVTDEMILVAGSTGSGVVGLIAPTPLVFTAFRTFTDISQIENFYDPTDQAFVMAKNMLGSSPSPVFIVLIDVLDGIADIGAAIALVDDGTWYALVIDSIIEADQQDVSDYAESRQRLFFATSSDATILDRIKSRRTSWLIHNVPLDHPEASWVAKNLPQTPGSLTWKFTNPLFGQTANEVTDLTGLQTIRAKNGQSYVKANGVSIVDEGRVTDPDGITFIDQVRSQDSIDLNMTADILQVFIDAGNAGSKVAYTDAGIAQIGTAVEKRLALAGRAGIIAPVETPEQAELSTDGVFRFKVNLPTRDEILAADPSQIEARNLPGITFQYVEAGAIHEVKTITGRVVLSEVA